MVRLALDASAIIDFNTAYWQQLVARTAQSYLTGLGLTPTRLGGLIAGVSNLTPQALILVHPLWDQNAANWRSDVAAAVADAEDQGFTADLRSVFNAVRFPYE